MILIYDHLGYSLAFKKKILTTGLMLLICFMDLEFDEIWIWNPSQHDQQDLEKLDFEWNWKRVWMMNGFLNLEKSDPIGIECFKSSSENQSWEIGLACCWKINWI